MASSDIKPFKVDIPKDEVDRLFRKLRDTRVPKKEIVPGAGTQYGPTFEWAVNLYKDWTEKYDWESEQTKINEFPHFLTPVENLTIHFQHQRSKNPNAIPILLVHGWPGSFHEFNRVVGPLSSPPRSSDQAFHVVVPSLPGFCWSSPPLRPGWTMQDNARVLNQLMKKLGYEEYVVQCGDWGHFVGRELGSKFTDSCKAVHFNFAPSAIPEDVEPTEREGVVMDRVKSHLEDHIGYAVCMRSRPHTIGWALTDNPIGIMMWVGEKYNEAASPGSQKQAFWNTAILTTVSLFFFTDCIMSSMLCYYENVRHHNFAAYTLIPEHRVTVPMAYTSFLWDTEPSSKRAVERTANLVFYKERDDGGHFAALEVPEGIVEGCREFFAKHH